MDRQAFIDQVVIHSTMTIAEAEAQAEMWAYDLLRKAILALGSMQPDK